MAHDVFISHSSGDKSVADAVCATLEQDGIRCWIAPRDIRPGSEWSASLMDGIKQSRVLVLILSRAANGSPHIIREVERAIHLGIPVVPFRIEDVAPSGGLEYHLGTLHWLDAMTPPLRAHLQPLGDTVRAILGAERPSPLVHARTLPGRRSYAIAGGTAVLAVTLVVGFLTVQVSSERPRRTDAPADRETAVATDSAVHPVSPLRDGSSSTSKAGQSPSTDVRTTRTRSPVSSTVVSTGAVRDEHTVPDRASLERLVGEYDNGTRIEVVSLDGDGGLTYFVPGEALHELAWERDWRFRMKDASGVEIEFVRGRGGDVTMVVAHLPNNVRVPIPRRFGEAPSRAVLESLSGDYGGDPPATVTLEQGELRFTFPGHPVYPLRFANGLHFAAKDHPALSFEFVRGADGAIAYVLVHQIRGNVSLPRKR